MKKTIEKPSKTLQTIKTLKTLIISYYSQNHQNNFDQGVHDHDVLVDLVHIPGGKMQIFSKLEQY